ncbi:hypothetical protein B0H17DRAFT_1142582 [Mycena rosella]|uniref:Uncharacterized protein n=1 Tax=Mycena rosella TaxID=1033263 RepID=A0AAD7CXH8_MYCRO|nr:hypothetical protein B0H17DRAFT_1142582 [Mycena rosella]
MQSTQRTAGSARGTSPKIAQNAAAKSPPPRATRGNADPQNAPHANKTRAELLEGCDLDWSNMTREDAQKHLYAKGFVTEELALAMYTIAADVQPKSVVTANACRAVAVLLERRRMEGVIDGMAADMLALRRLVESGARGTAPSAEASALAEEMRSAATVLTKTVEEQCGTLETLTERLGESITGLTERVQNAAEEEGVNQERADWGMQQKKIMEMMPQAIPGGRMDPGRAARMLEELPQEESNMVILNDEEDRRSMARIERRRAEREKAAAARATSKTVPLAPSPRPSPIPAQRELPPLDEALMEELSVLERPERYETVEEVEAAIQRVEDAIQRVIAAQVKMSKLSPYWRQWYTLLLDELRKESARLNRESYRRRHVPDYPVHEEARIGVKVFCAAVQDAKDTHWVEWLRDLSDNRVWDVGKMASAEPGDGAAARLPILEQRHPVSGVVRKYRGRLRAKPQSFSSMTTH